MSLLQFHNQNVPIQTVKSGIGSIYIRHIVSHWLPFSGQNQYFRCRVLLGQIGIYDMDYAENLTSKSPSLDDTSSTILQENEPSKTITSQKFIPSSDIYNDKLLEHPKCFVESIDVLMINCSASLDRQVFTHDNISFNVTDWSGNNRQSLSEIGIELDSDQPAWVDWDGQYMNTLLYLASLDSQGRICIELSHSFS